MCASLAVCESWVAPGHRERHRESPIMQQDPIAIIGIGCRLPGADNHRQFWDVIRNDCSEVSEVPQSRWGMGKRKSADGSYEGAGRQQISKWAGLIDDVD